MGKDVAKADANLGKLRKSAKNTAANFKALGQSMTMYVGAPLALLGGLMTKTAVDFDDAMRQVQAVTGATGEEFKDLTDLARDLGATTSFSAKQAAEGMIFLGRAGFTTTQIMSSLDDTLDLARATATDLGTTADILSNIMTAFNIPAEDAGRAVDVLAATTASANTDLIQLGEAMTYVAPVASKMGMSLEDTAAAAGFLSNVGIQASMAGTSLRGMLMSVAAPTGTAKTALEKYGLAMEDINPVTHDLVDILNTLNDAGVGITDTMQIFGLRAGPGTAELLSKGGDSLSAYIGKLEDTEGAASRMAKTMDEGPGGSVRMLKSALEGLKIEFGTIIAEALLPAATAAQKLTVFFTDLPDPIKKGIVALGGLAIAVSGLTLAIGVITPMLGAGGTLAVGMAAVKGGALALAGAVSSLSLPLVAVAGVAVLAEKKFHIFSDTITILGDYAKNTLIPIIKEKITAAFDRMLPRIKEASEFLHDLYDSFIEITGIDTGFLDDWHQRAEDIRNKNEELAQSNRDIADSVNSASDAFDRQKEAIAGVSAEIPGYAGHTRELIEAGLAGEAGFRTREELAPGLGEKEFREKYGTQKFMDQLESEREVRLGGPAETTEPTMDFRQFATMGQTAFMWLTPDMIKQQPAMKEDQNTKKIEENTKEINTATLENGTLIFQASQDIQKAVRESKTRSIGGFTSFFRSAPT